MLWSSEKQESIKSAAELKVTAKVNLYYILTISEYRLVNHKGLVETEVAGKGFQVYI